MSRILPARMSQQGSRFATVASGDTAIDGRTTAPPPVAAGGIAVEKLSER